jgi:3-oxoacyl-[acyl-carrier protein] reductase
LLGFTREWARELAPWNINVNSVAPGNAVTEIVRGAKARRMLAESATGVPLGRNAEVEELAYTVAFLASPEANFITGQTISPNGGEVIVGI